MKYYHYTSVPVRYLRTKTEHWIELCDIEGFYAETTDSKELWMIEEEIGRFDTYNYVGE